MVNNLSERTRYMVRVSIFVALEIVLALTPLGYLHAGVLEISLMMIPVAVGGLILGPGAGALLGGVFGLSSFLQCFGMSAFGAALLSINGFYTFLVCVPTRILAGWLPALLYRALSRRPGSALPWQALCCLLASLLNTIFFMGTLLLCFGSTDIVGFAASGMNVLAFVIAFVGVNTAVEIPATTVLGTAIVKALEAVDSSRRRKNGPDGGEQNS